MTRRIRGRIGDLDIPWHAERGARWLVRGFGGSVPLQDIADVYGVSRQAIEQVEKRALRKLARSGRGRAVLDAYEQRKPGVWDEIGLLETGRGLSEGHGGRTKKTA